MAPRRRLTLADLRPDQYEALQLAIHEAGHCVAGVVLGGQLSTAVVGRSRVTGAQGTTHFADLATERRPAVAFAGPHAQARWCAGGQRRPSQRETWRVLDTTGCKDFRAITASGASVGEVSGDVAALLDRCWPAVVTVAQQLHRVGEVDHAAVCAALGIPERDNGVHLSMIRSGRAPGSFTVTAAVS